MYYRNANVIAVLDGDNSGMFRLSDCQFFSWPFDFTQWWVDQSDNWKPITPEEFYNARKEFNCE